MKEMREIERKHEGNSKERQRKYQRIMKEQCRKHEGNVKENEGHMKG